MATENTTSNTLDGLAVMTNGAFSRPQKQRDGGKGTMQDIAEELHAQHEDVRYLRRSVTMLLRSDAARDAAINILSACVQCLGKEVGLPN